MGIKTIAGDANSFTGASGTTYIIYPSLSTKRFEVFEDMQVAVEHGTSVSAFRKELSDCYALLNQMKFADGCARLHNLLNGVERIANKQPHPVLLMCALFICPSSEDQSQWSEAEAQAKIEDWWGIDVAFFLGCARRLVARFMGAYASDSRTFSEGASSDAE